MIDVHLPDPGSGRCPAVVLVPGEAPAQRGLGPLLAGRGVVGVTVDHPPGDRRDYPRAAAQVRETADRVREHPRVDGDRVALWFFASGGPLCAGWLRAPPAWLRCVALTGPLLAGPSLEPGFRPVEAVEAVGAAAFAGVAGAMRANDLPIVLTRTDREDPEIAVGVAQFVAAARFAAAHLTIVEVPAGRHPDGSGQAVLETLDHVLTTLR